MARFIDADKALEILDGWLEASGALPKGTSYYHECKSCIDATPTEDVVPVVRCKNCKNRVKQRWPKCRGRKPDDYCSDGERMGK